jgi:hypothetical protein
MMGRRSVRRSQLVVPFGVGSILEFEDEALMPAGLDVWEDKPANRIYDQRLASRLQVQYFAWPPLKPEIDGPTDRMAPTPCVRFPQWHFCPRCRGLTKVDLYADRRPRCGNRHVSPRLASKAPCGNLPESRRPTVLPLRFLAACPAGHVEDFPWHAWAHGTPGRDLTSTESCKPEALYFYATRAGGLAGLRVQCGHCGNDRSLLGATAESGLRGWRCGGHRPWLGKDGREECSAAPNRDGQRNMVALQRGASNIYFPEVASSILIPPHSTRVGRLLADPDVIGILDEARQADGLTDAVFKMAARGQVRWEELKEAYEASSRRGEATVGEDETSFRYAEYLALRRDRRDENDELACRTQRLEDYTDLMRQLFSRITLVERLTETRALVGFRRILPAGDAMAAISRGNMRWRPAFQVRGEGLFLELRSDRVAEFEGRVTERLRALIDRAVSVSARRRAFLPISARLLLLHTFAHLLIKRLSFDAGYGASSIRERLYGAEGEEDMAGVLLYTAAGDADGTLGGLVELGRPGRLERAVAGALEDARWCGSDPICVESRGQGPDSLNLAACHACALLPETCCELQNRILDRACVLDFFQC